MSARTDDEVFAALGDPTRLRIVDRLARSGPASASELARAFPMSRQAVAKHLGILADAGVTTRRRHGREVRFSVASRPLTDAAAWLSGRAAMWDETLASLKRHLEH